MGDDIVIKNLEDYVAASQYFYYFWQKNKSLNEVEMIQDILKKFSIGNVMQIVCDSLEEKK